MKMAKIGWIRVFRWAVVAAAAGGLGGINGLTASALAKNEGGCVWKLSDGDNTVYLAGSVHLLREKDHPLPGIFDVAYDDSSELVFEIDMSLMSSPTAGATMQRLGTYPRGESLAKHISEDTYVRLQDYFLSRRVPASTLDRLRPGMIFLTMSSLEASRLGARADLGLETQYYQRSVVDGKPSRGLETIEYQLSRFDELGEKEVDSLIRETLEEIDEMPKMIDGIIGAWRSGDTRKLDELLNEQMGEEDRVRELLLTDRNQNWIPEIEKALAGKRNVMFIVGAAHLVGKKSVVDLLEQKGHKVELLKPQKRPSVPLFRKKAA